MTDDIHQVGGGDLTSPEDAAIYLVRSDDRGVLVDAGCGYSQIQLFQNIEACGVKLDHIEYLLITHCHFDHTGGAQGVKDRTGCRIVAHEKEAGFLEEGDQRVTAAKWYGAFLKPFQVDTKLKGEHQELWVGQKRIDSSSRAGPLSRFGGLCDRVRGIEDPFWAGCPRAS